MSPLIHDSCELPLERNRSIFDYADSLKVRVPTSCGRTGECHECIVEVRRGVGALSPPTASEKFLRDNYRLACQAIVKDPDAVLEFSVLRRQPRILMKGVRRKFAMDPVVVRVDDAVICLNGGSIPGIGESERIDKYRGAIYGVAADVGTTTVVLNLVDLESGKTLRTASFENPQRFGGSDVMRRISYDGGIYNGELKAVMLSSINFEIGEICKRIDIRRRHIYEMVIVGNSTMRDLLFGLDVQSIGEKPYRSTVEQAMKDGKRGSTALHATAGELGVRIHPNAHVYGGPLIGSHVGADVAADLLAVAMDETDEPSVLVDVGTNTEIVVGTRQRMLAASCPAGPAFEGGEVTYSMPGYEGAVEKVRICDDRVEYETIGGSQAQGICGSGLIDLLAELRRIDRMNELGVFAGGAREFTFEPERGMTLSRADVSALAQAKAANYCGQSIVLREFGLPLTAYGHMYLAGGFANYVDPGNAINIGFIANLPEAEIVKVGNAAVEGATIMLLSGQLRTRMESLVKGIEHVELETAPDFFEFFVEGCQFKPMTIPEPVK